MGAMKDMLSEQNEEVEVSEEQNESVEVTMPKMQPTALTMWNDKDLFEATQRMAKLLVASEIIPQSYRGKIADCVIAIDMANRMGVSPIIIMQNSQIVQGNFSWKGTACKAMIDGCGKYKYSRYVEVGERGTDSWGFYLEATEKKGDVVKGPVVDIAMAKAEGWYGKNGSKWRTMPELMLKYRAAAFFFRTECASLAMGFLTTEEQEDISN